MQCQGKQQAFIEHRWMALHPINCCKAPWVVALHTWAAQAAGHVIAHAGAEAAACNLNTRWRHHLRTRK